MPSKFSSSCGASGVPDAFSRRTPASNSSLPLRIHAEWRPSCRCGDAPASTPSSGGARSRGDARRAHHQATAGQSAGCCPRVSDIGGHRRYAGPIGSSAWPRIAVTGRRTHPLPERRRPLDDLARLGTLSGRASSPATDRAARRAGTGSAHTRKVRCERELGEAAAGAARVAALHVHGNEGSRAARGRDNRWTLWRTNSSGKRTPSRFSTRSSSRTTVLSRFPPRARPSFQSVCTSCRKPKVRARQISRSKPSPSTTRSARAWRPIAGWR